ncbi:MAG: EAL domain-containing protein [Wenzhouxiangellaceae bacterium]|nr:EAL domain-containing protein [Wenzhouxiangellaceae bacterium]
MSDKGHLLATAQGRVPWVIATVLLALLLFATLGLSRALQLAEKREIERYFDAVVGHVQADIVGSARHQAEIQSRMAKRLALAGGRDEATWRADAANLIEDHPFYEMLAVLDPDLVVRWVIDRRGVVEPGSRFPISAAGLRELSRRSMSISSLPLEPLGGDTGLPGLLYMTPVLVDGEVVHWLVAVVNLPETIELTLTSFYQREVILNGAFGGYEFSIPDDAGAAEGAASDYRRMLEFELGDGRSELQIEIVLRPDKVAEMQSALPGAVLLLGGTLALLLVLAALLAMAATRQARVLSDANRTLKSEIRDRELAERELAFLLTHDSLTGLPNRQGMLRELERAIEDLDDAHCLAVFFFDLDQFKDINETLGHHMGDELLRQVPGRLSRELDDADVLGRLGGDEFLVLVRRRDHERVARMADRLLHALERPFRIDEHQLFVTASIGVAHLDSASASPAELIQNADAALFRAKQLGRNQYALFTPEMFARVEYRLKLSQDIREALEQDEFRVCYQPIVNLQTLRICGVEALLRWPHRDGYNVPPRDFIRVAEETGVVHRLSRHALARAVQDLAAWQLEFADPPWLAVNISGAQFREADFVGDIGLLLHQYRIAPDQVHLEITEEVLIENMVRNRAILAQLDEIGMPVVVDDFGVGYSSLAYIKNFPVSTIKIDQCFVRELEDDPEDQAITRTICDLSRELSLHTVAEGIEHPGQLELLRGYGCNMGQGFLFMHAVPADEIAELLAGDLPWAGLSEVLDERGRQSRHGAVR